MKRLLVLAALLASAGCSSGPCQDVLMWHQGLVGTYSTYHECGKQCCKAKARECYCSKSCSCCEKRLALASVKEVIHQNPGPAASPAAAKAAVVAGARAVLKDSGQDVIQDVDD